jgi:FkbM family methyltransferase
MYNTDIVFDVGANVGLNAGLYLQKFPGSRIYCFEPVTNTFLQLQKNLKGEERINCYRLALGSSKRKGTMVLHGSDNRLFFILDQSRESLMSHNPPTETVDIITLDDFCKAKGINHINYLKIDTEGGDLDVLKGAMHMLTRQNVDIVQVEAGMNPGNNSHVPFETLKAFLESYQYFLFGFYEQVNEWPSGKPHLRRSDTLFISYKMIERNILLL